MLSKLTSAVSRFYDYQFDELPLIFSAQPGHHFALSEFGMVDGSAEIIVSPSGDDWSVGKITLRGQSRANGWARFEAAAMALPDDHPLASMIATAIETIRKDEVEAMLDEAGALAIVRGAA